MEESASRTKLETELGPRGNRLATGFEFEFELAALLAAELLELPRLRAIAANVSNNPVPIPGTLIIINQAIKNVYIQRLIRCY